MSHREKQDMTSTDLIAATHIILYVADQARSAAFYARVLHCAPSLDVPGMTEFRLSAACVLGLMPEAGIKRLLGSRLPDPAQGAGIPRAELYLRVANALEYHRRALEAGAIELSEPRDRDWGDRVAYALDPDGHVLAFAEKQVANFSEKFATLETRGPEDAEMRPAALRDRAGP